jgi:hypothetical protein
MLRRRLENDGGNHYEYDVWQRSDTIETWRELEALRINYE